MAKATVDEIADIPNVHAERMANTDVTIGDVTFTLRPLTMRHVYFAQAAPDMMLRGAEQVRLAIAAVDGLEPEWEEVEILGNTVCAVTLDWFADLSPRVISKLRAKVAEISSLTGGELVKLDFI